MMHGCYCCMHEKSFGLALKPYLHSILSFQKIGLHQQSPNDTFAPDKQLFKKVYTYLFIFKSQGYPCLKLCDQLVTLFSLPAVYDREDL